MDVTVFYSWQSDRPKDLCRYLIRDAANKALRQLGTSVDVEPSPRLDHDTKGESGMPEIAKTIFRKIQRAGFFLADVTFVGSADSADAEHEKLLPNPNVLVELGFAARAIGWERIMCVMNEFFGLREEQILNIRHRRLPIGYTLQSKAERSDALAQLAERIKRAVSALMWARHNGVSDAIARLDVPCLAFLKLNANVENMTPPPMNEVTIAAPAGTLDTSAYQHAAARLLDIGLIQCRADQSTGQFVYGWTYLGVLVLRELGWRHTT